MEELDILYMTRVQKERFFNEEDYIRLKDSYILDLEKLKTAKEDLTIMHLPRESKRNFRRSGRRSESRLLLPGVVRKTHQNGSDSVSSGYQTGSLINIIPAAAVTIDRRKTRPGKCRKSQKYPDHRQHRKDCKPCGYTATI